MKRFKDLIIECGSDAAALAELVRIENACQLPEFRYDEQVEQMYEPDDKMAHILVEMPGIPKAVMLVWVHDGCIKVINVVPFMHSADRISIEHYNRMVDAFQKQIVEPVIDNRYLVKVTAGDYSLAEIIPNSYEHLSRWSNCPGAPQAPFSHPNDLELWFEFLSQLKNRDEELSTGQLEQWLREEKQWPEDVIEETILKFEEEVALLDYYVSRYA